MKNKVLVTGGCGYLGSTLVPKLLDNGFAVTVIDNMMFGQSSLNQVCLNPNFNFIFGDIRDQDLIKSQCAIADIIIPLAAYVGAPICAKDPTGAHTVNNVAVKMMLSQLSSDQLVIMPTTNSAYGSGGDDNYCDEKTLLNPISKYAVDKVEIENELMQRPLSISFRLATVFGMSPRMRLDLLVNDFTYRALNDRFLVLFESHFKRNYIHVTDVAEAFLHGIRNASTMAGEIYNVGLSDANVSKWQLCQEIKKHLPEFYFVEADVGADPDQRNYLVSNAKIEATGYKPRVSLSAGISELIKGLKMINNRKHGNV